MSDMQDAVEENTRALQSIERRLERFLDLIEASMPERTVQRADVVTNERNEAAVAAIFAQVEARDRAWKLLRGEEEVA